MKYPWHLCDAQMTACLPSMHKVAKFRRDEPLPEKFLCVAGAVELQPGKKRSQRRRGTASHQCCRDRACLALQSGGSLP